MNERIFNFSPGPATLPEPVLRAVREAVWNYNGSGIGVMELSHRSQEFEGIIFGAENLLRTLLQVPKNYHVLFLTGGATTQFSAVPMNLLGGGVGNYLLSGHWAERALEEGKKFGPVHIAGSTKEQNFSELPKVRSVSENASYLHFTSNNTIYGTQFREEPDAFGAPLICDASSDILSRPIEIAKYGYYYGGAQKNAGAAGVTIGILREDLLERCQDSLPILLNYRTYVESRSLYNTPPTISIYVVYEVLRWIESVGGLQAITARNEEKAALLYAEINRSGFYVGTASPSSRSLMNITFRLKEQNLEAQFIKEAEAARLSGLKGYRSVGGVRASLYNAMSLEGVQALVSFMREFERKNG